MARAFILSLQSLSDRRILSVLFKSLVVTIAAFASSGIVLWFGIEWMLEKYTAQSSGIAAFAAFMIMVLAGWVLWRAAAIAALWFFSDDIAEATELRHYPDAAKTSQRPGTAKSASLALRSVGRALGYNLLAIPLYVVLLVTGIGPAIAFLFVNGLLLGRDLEDMLLVRYGPNYAKSQGGFSKWPRLILGLLGTAAMLLPFVNLIVPVVAVAMAVHMTHLKLGT